MSIFLTILHVVVCLVLILVILLQAGRGQGLASASFGSGNVQSLFGTRAADFLTKATTVSAICFILTSIGLDFLEVKKSKSLMEISQRSAPINLEQIKQALEKVKAEKTPEAPDQTQEESPVVQPTVSVAADGADTEPVAAETSSVPAAEPEPLPTPTGDAPKAENAT